MKSNFVRIVPLMLYFAVGLFSRMANAAEITIYLYPQSSRYEAGYFKESGSSYTCPYSAGMVMTGRFHTGDENGYTMYECAGLRAINKRGEHVPGTISVQWGSTSSCLRESSGYWFEAPYQNVMIGRTHNGDENGYTCYNWGRVTFNGASAFIVNSSLVTAGPIKESTGIWLRTDWQRVMTGRMHTGDENGSTYYRSGILAVRVPAPPLRVVAKLHPEDGNNSFPHNDYLDTEISLDDVGMISEVCLSARKEIECYTAADLQISPENGGQKLVVYAAKSSHALYVRPGKYNVPRGVDVAQDGGQEVDITAYVKVKDPG